MLVSRTKAKIVLGILWKTWATFCHCFVHQHGLLITWVKNKNLDARFLWWPRETCLQENVNCSSIIFIFLFCRLISTLIKSYESMSDHMKSFEQYVNWTIPWLFTVRRFHARFFFGGSFIYLFIHFFSENCLLVLVSLFARLDEAVRGEADHLQ